MVGPTNGIGGVYGIVLKTLNLKKSLQAHKCIIVEDIDLPMVNPSDLSYFNGYIYINDATEGKIYKFMLKNLYDFEQLSINISHPWGILVERNNIFITDDIDMTVNRLSLDTLEIEKTKNIPNSDMHGLSYFGNNLIAVNDWVSKSILILNKELEVLPQSRKLYLPDIAGLYINIEDNTMWITDSTLSLISKIKGEQIVYYKGVKGHLHGIVQIKNNEYLLVERNSKKLYRLKVE